MGWRRSGLSIAPGKAAVPCVGVLDINLSVNVGCESQWPSHVTPSEYLCSKGGMAEDQQC